MAALPGGSRLAKETILLLDVVQLQNESGSMFAARGDFQWYPTKLLFNLKLVFQFSVVSVLTANCGTNLWDACFPSRQVLTQSGNKFSASDSENCQQRYDLHYQLHCVSPTARMHINSTSVSE
jgi:hypothetical protein